MNDEILAPTSEEGLRKEALANIRRKRAFKQTVVAYVCVNAFLVLIWALGDAGYFWPGWVIGGWGIGLALQGWDAYRTRRGVSEDEVRREMERMRGS
jgi:hypothetical protein